MQTNLNDINGGGNGTWGFAPLFPPGDALLPTALFFCGYPPTRPFRAPLKELAIDIQIRSSRVATNYYCYGRGILTTSSKVSPAVAKQIHRGVVQRVKGGGAYELGGTRIYISEWLDSIDNHGGLTLVAKNGHHPDLGGLGLMSDLHLSTQPPSF